MNWKHFVALIQLRYRLSANQVKKAGRLNVVLSILALSIALICSVSAFFVGIIGGAIWFQEASTTTILITWNIIVVLFLAMWTVGLLVELQQTELMSIDKLLHLPISLRGAFFLNYTSSFVNTTFIMFVPMMIGLSIGLVVARGIGMLLAIPLVIGFLFLITTLTYQLRGWLGRIMENKRTRGTVIAVITIFFVALSQVPNLISMQFRGSGKERRQQQQVMMENIKELGRLEIDARITAGEIQREEQTYWLASLDVVATEKAKAKREQDDKDLFEYSIEIVEQADTYLPPGWLPLGVLRADQGKWLPGVLASIAMFAIGLISLSFSYRSSMRKYTGVEPRRRRRKSKQDSAKPDEFLFKKLPLVSEHVSAVAVSGYRGLMRAPEFKMVLILPFMLGLVGVSLLIGKQDFTIPTPLRPWIPVGIITVTMFGLTSLLFNQFGIDRDGFRAYMLSPIERKDILIGKNIAVAPLAAGICLVLIFPVQIFVPQGFFSFAASLLQIPAVYLLYCMLGNLVSIYFPMGIKRGTMQPANPRFLPILIMVIGVMVGPMVLMIPTMVACGIPVIIEATTKLSMGWLFLLLSAIQLGLTWIGYKWLINHQARWLWNREPKILDVVANIPE